MLKEAGMPEETAVKMTENYMSAFTSLSDIMKKAVYGSHSAGMYAKQEKPLKNS